MSKSRLFVLPLLVVLFVGCWHDQESIVGLWISTPETSKTFLSGTRKTVLRIQKQPNGQLTAQGVFLWNGEYSEKWVIENIEYEEPYRYLTLLDGDGDTYKATFDHIVQQVRGSVHIHGGLTDSLNFIRAEKQLETALFIPRIPNDDGIVTYSYKTPEQLDDGLQTASILDDDFDSLQLSRLMQEIIAQKYGRMESLLIFKDNKLVLEEYYYGYNKRRLAKISSCTKSVTSIILGIAMDRHVNAAVEQSIFDYFPEYIALKKDDKKQITLKHLLTMTAGFEWNEYPKEMYETDDRIEYVLSRPLETIPGEQFHYNSGITNVLGGVLESLEGDEIEMFADQYLFSPLGITEYIWDTTQNGDLEYWNGLHLLPRDMGKMGLLVLNQGKWENKQVVSEKWIDESTRSNVAESNYFGYGYQWWHRSKENAVWWEKTSSGLSDEHDMVIALGSGGKYIMIIRDLGIVVVSTASNFDNGEKEFSTFPLVIEEILPLFDEVRL